MRFYIGLFSGVLEGSLVIMFYIGLFSGVLEGSLVIMFYIGLFSGVLVKWANRTSRVWCLQWCRKTRHVKACAPVF